MSSSDEPPPARFCRLWTDLTPAQRDALTGILLNTHGHNPCPWEDQCPHPLLCLDNIALEEICACPRAHHWHHDQPTPTCRCHGNQTQPSKKPP